jgi:A1 cistron-splicing factor AAR2
MIGELQFCFLTILTLNNFSCLEQWKRLLSLLLTCKAAVPKRAGLFVSAIATLRLQLQHCKDTEGGLIDLADEGGSLLKTLLVRFRKGFAPISTVSAIDTDVQDVLDELDDLEDYLRTEHGWSFGGAFAKSGVLELEDGEEVRGVETTAFDEDDETGEFAPQMVDLTKEQREALGLGGEIVLRERLSKASLHDGREGVGGMAVDLSCRNLVEEASSGSETDENTGKGAQFEVSEEETGDLDEMDARY